MKNYRRVHLFISGQVQGVFFRAHTATKAQKLGLAGWVRNTADGRVEAVFEGEKEKLAKIIRWCQKGPPVGRVEAIEMVWEKNQGEKRFEVRN